MNMGFLTERVKSLLSKKVAGGVAGALLLDGHPWPQAAVIIAYLLGQAWVDARK
jgi:hypothetical protein